MKRTWLFLAVPGMACACTNLIVTPGASADGSSLFSYNADSDSMFGTLAHWPASTNKPGQMFKIYDWDSGVYLGEMEEPATAYNVIGNINEKGVGIGETTFGGNETLSGGPGVLDYGNLIWQTLRRVTSAREAIKMFDNLTSQYGYVSEGESFTIADNKEVWVLELVGKGKYEKGAVWVAVRIPDGHVSGHANQARIQTFPWSDPANCYYSKDLLSFAARNGFWDASRPKEEFNFAQAFDPIAFAGARMSDARVWSFFGPVAEDPGFQERYEAYVLGKNVSAEARMPLSIRPKQKLSWLDLSDAMRNHYEGTEMDGRNDVGGQASHSPFRSRPLNWKYKDEAYFNERTVGVQQTGWNFVAQLRPKLPTAIGTVIWFGVDDSTFAARVPFHGGALSVPKQFADGNGDALHFSETSAFWVFNSVANFVYPRWYLAPSVIERARSMEAKMNDGLPTGEAQAIAMYEKDPLGAMRLLTEFSTKLAENVVTEEWSLFKELMVTYRDGFRVSAAPNAPDHGGIFGGVVPKVEELGSDDAWNRRVVADTGDHYKVPATNHGFTASKMRALQKGSSGTRRPRATSDVVLV